MCCGRVATRSSLPVTAICCGRAAPISVDGISNVYYSSRSLNAYFDA